MVALARLSLHPTVHRLLLPEVQAALAALADAPWGDAMWGRVEDDVARQLAALGPTHRAASAALAAMAPLCSDRVRRLQQAAALGLLAATVGDVAAPCAHTWLPCCAVWCRARALTGCRPALDTHTRTSALPLRPATLRAALPNRVCRPRAPGAVAPAAAAAAPALPGRRPLTCWST